MNSAPNSKWTIFDTAEALIKQNRKNNINHNIRIFIALLITALNRNYTVACTYENNLQSLCDISNIQGVPKKRRARWTANAKRFKIISRRVRMSTGRCCAKRSTRRSFRGTDGQFSHSAPSYVCSRRRNPTITPSSRMEIPSDCAPSSIYANVKNGTQWITIRLKCQCS